MRAPRALVVDAFAVGEEGPPIAVHSRQPPERQVVHDGGGYDVADGWTTGDVHDRPVLDDVANAHRACRVGARSLHAPPVRTRADGKDRGGAVSRFLHQILGGAPTYHSIDAAFLRRDRPGDHEHVLPLVGGHRALLGPFDSFTSACHERVIVVERYHVEEKVADGRVGRAEHALDAAGTLLQLQPDDARPLHRFERPGDARAGGAAETEYDSDLSAELHKIAARDAARLKVLA